MSIRMASVIWGGIDKGAPMPAKRLSPRDVTNALRETLDQGGTFDIGILHAAGVVLAGEELPRMRDDNVLLLEFSNDQVFEVVVRERK